MELQGRAMNDESNVTASTRGTALLPWIPRLSLDFLWAMLVMTIAERDPLLKISSWLDTERILGACAFTAVGIYQRWYSSRK